MKQILTDEAYKIKLHGEAHNMLVREKIAEYESNHEYKKFLMEEGILTI